MTVFVVDTNILVYAADADSPDHAECRRRVEAWRRQATPWHLTWGIVYEYLRVSTHANVFRKPFTMPQAWSFIEAILASPSLEMLVETDRHASVASAFIEEVSGLRGNLAFDAHTAILMREHGIRRIYTRDMDFHRFPDIEVIDPTGSSGKGRRGRGKG